MHRIFAALLKPAARFSRSIRTFTPFFGAVPAVFALLLLIPFLLPAAEREIVVLATSDTHGCTFPAKPGWEQLAARIRQCRAKHPDAVLADCGDTFQGSYGAFATRGRLFAEILRLLRYDFFVPGNHDFEFGGRILLANLKALPAQCRVLAANLAPCEDSPHLPCCTIRKNGVRIGFIGLSETQIPFRVLPCDLAPFRFCDEKQALFHAVHTLKKEQVQAIVLLRHNGLYSRSGALFELIRPYPEIKLVIGGHTHELNSGSKVGHALYVQPGCRGNALAEAVLVFDERDGRFLQCRSRLHAVSGEHGKDPRIAQFLKKQIDSLPYRYTRFAVPEELRLPSRLALEAMCRATGAEAALLRAAKEEIPLIAEAGIFSLYRSFPYANKVCLLELTREEFNALLADQRSQDRRDKFQKTAWLDRSRPEAAVIRTAIPDYLLAGAGKGNSGRMAEKRKVLNPAPPFLLDAVIRLLETERLCAPGRRD